MNSMDAKNSLNETHYWPPRRRASGEIKLLRLELVVRGQTPCDGIGVEWSLAQPTENLSPESAAAALGVEIWCTQSGVKNRYRTLQLRYPPEQFSERHLEWRPAAELLSSPRARLNWYWQSGLIPHPSSKIPGTGTGTDAVGAAEGLAMGVLWDSRAVEPILDSQTAIQRFANISRNFKTDV